MYLLNLWPYIYINYVISRKMVLILIGIMLNEFVTIMLTKEMSTLNLSWFMDVLVSKIFVCMSIFTEWISVLNVLYGGKVWER